MILTEDINTVVLTALNAQSALTGKAWPNHGPDAPTAYPYAVFVATPLEAESYSGPKYTQRWRVRAAAYVPVGAPSAISVIDTLKALVTALGISSAVVVAALRNSGEAVRATRPVDGDDAYAPTMREGKDVLVAGVSVELLCEGDRSVA